MPNVQLDHVSALILGATSAVIAVLWGFLRLWVNAKKLLAEEERSREVADAEARLEVAKAEAEIAKLKRDSQPELPSVRKVP